VLASAAAAGLWLLGQGMVDLFQLELTPRAVVELRGGRLLVWAALLLNGAVAVVALRRGFAPAAAAGVATPVVLGGALLLVAEDTLLPQLAVLGTLPVGIGGLLVLLVSPRSRARGPGARTRS
jgi:hypothetical protein